MEILIYKLLETFILLRISFLSHLMPNSFWSEIMQLFPEIELDFHLILGWLRNLIGLAYQAGQSPGLRQDNNTPDNGEEREAAKSKE